jgi:hypothetical protein
VVIDAWPLLAVVIVVGALVADRTRAYRALPVMLNRLRARSRSADHPQTSGVDSAELLAAATNRSDFAGREKEPRNGEGH